MKIRDEREMQKSKGRKKQRGAEVIVKGRELNDFVVHLS